MFSSQHKLLLSSSHVWFTAHGNTGHKKERVMRFLSVCIVNVKFIGTPSNEVHVGRKETKKRTMRS